MKEKLLAVLKQGIKEYTTDELLGWRIDLLKNPYKKEGVNLAGMDDLVIKVIEQELVKRRIMNFQSVN